MPSSASDLGESIRCELLLLRDLAADLIACRSAFTGSDMERMYAHISHQAALSEQLTAAQQARIRAWHAFAGDSSAPASATKPSLHSSMDALDAETAAHVRALLTELALAEGEVRNLNRVHSLLLDGSRRSLHILFNALAAFAPTCSLPRPTPLTSEALPIPPPVLETSRT